MEREGEIEFEFDALPVTQPIGDFYIASLPAWRLVEITDFDVRRVVKERDVESYLGIQRPLNKGRVKELGKYVRTSDAVFPTAVIIAVDADAATWDPVNKRLSLRNRPDLDTPILYREIARVLDGQHRLAGLEGYSSDNFDINVSIFVDADIADQAMIFSTVNLAQTKVQRSLAFDLLELAKSRSPQRFCHQMTVTLDRESGSPFHKMIKRLGVATPGRTGETLSQATVVQAFLSFVTNDALIDRDLYLRGKVPDKLPEPDLKKHPFQHLFIEERDFEIVDVVWNFFQAARDRWPHAWERREKGNILNRTNGFRALVRLLKDVYLQFGETVPSVVQFEKLFVKIDLKDEDFNTDNFPPGTTGESNLYRYFRDCVNREFY